MDGPTIKLLLASIIKLGTLLPLVVVAYLTVNYVDATLTVHDGYDITQCVENEYGLFRMCSQNCEGFGKRNATCKTLKFDLTQEDSPMRDMIITLLTVAIAMISLLCLTVHPFIKQIRKKYSTTLDACIGMGALVALIFGILHTMTIKNHWEDRDGLEDKDSNILHADVKLSTSFYVHIASCCATVLVVGLSLFYFRNFNAKHYPDEVGMGDADPNALNPGI